MALYANNETIVRELLKGGARPRIKNMLQSLLRHPGTISTPFLPYLKDMVFERDADSGKTILHWAVESGIAALITRCLDLSADINATDKYGETALHYAAGDGHLDIVQILVQANADKTISDSHGRTALIVRVDMVQGVTEGLIRRWLLSCSNGLDRSSLDRAARYRLHTYVSIESFASVDGY